MNDVPETELFSAYLDGELTADEQVRVEQILATSPASRQLLEELRSLGGTLQGLPQQKLDEDLSRRVIEAAERRMLLPERLRDEPADSLPNDEAAAAEISARPSAGRAAATMQADQEHSWRHMFSRRALIWSGVVLATGLIIHFTTPQPNPQARIQAKVEVKSAAANANGAWVAAGGDAAKPQAGEEMAKAEGRKAGKDAAPEEERLAMRGAAKDDDRHFNMALRDGKKSEQLGRDESPKADDLANIDHGKAAHDMEKPAPLPERQLAEKRPAPAIDAVAGAAVPAAAPMAPAAAPAVPPAPLGTAGKVAADAPVQSFAGGSDRNRLMNGTNAPPARNAPAAAMSKAGDNRFGYQAAPGAPPPGTTPAAIIVICDVSEAAVRNKDFENLLARQNPSGSQNTFMRSRRSSSGGTRISGQQEPAPVQSNLQGQLQGNGQGNLQAPAGLAGPQGGRDSKAKEEVAKADKSLAETKRAEKGGSQTETAKDLKQQQSPEPLVYECDLSQEQFDMLIQQIGARRDSFSLPKIALADNAGNYANQSVQQSNDRANDRTNDLAKNGQGGGRGGLWNMPAGEPQQAKSGINKAFDPAAAKEVEKLDANKPGAYREESAQSPLTPAPSTPAQSAQVQSAPKPAPQKATAKKIAPAAQPVKQHVVFYLNKVDRLPPAAGVITAPANAAPAPAVQAPAPPPPAAQQAPSKQ